MIAYLLVSLIIMIIIYMIGYYISLYMHAKRYGEIIMTYKQFEPLYNINPDKYELYIWKDEGACVKYSANKGVWSISKAGVDYFLIYFKYPWDWIRVKYLIRRHNKRYAEQYSMKQMNNYLKHAQEDITKYKEELTKNGYAESGKL